MIVSLVILASGIIGAFLLCGTPEDFNAPPPHEPRWARPVNNFGWALMLPCLHFWALFFRIAPEPALIPLVLGSLPAAWFWGALFQWIS